MHISLVFIGSFLIKCCNSPSLLEIPMQNMNKIKQKIVNILMKVTFCYGSKFDPSNFLFLLEPSSEFKHN